MRNAIFSDDVITVCKSIGENLRSHRINFLDEKQDVMAKRLGVSRDTYIRMEKGDPSVKIGFWLEAAKITQNLDQWQALFSSGDSLFDQHELKKKQRKRASS